MNLNFDTNAMHYNFTKSAKIAKRGIELYDMYTDEIMFLSSNCDNMFLVPKTAVKRLNQK